MKSRLSSGFSAPEPARYGSGVNSVIWEIPHSSKRNNSQAKKIADRCWAVELRVQLAPHFRQWSLHNVLGGQSCTRKTQNISKQVLVCEYHFVHTSQKKTRSVKRYGNSCMIMTVKGNDAQIKC